MPLALPASKQVVDLNYRAQADVATAALFILSKCHHSNLQKIRQHSNFCPWISQATPGCCSEVGHRMSRLWCATLWCDGNRFALCLLKEAFQVSWLGLSAVFGGLLLKFFVSLYHAISPSSDFSAITSAERPNQWPVPFALTGGLRFGLAAHVRGLTGGITVAFFDRVCKKMPQSGFARMSAENGAGECFGSARAQCTARVSYCKVAPAKLQARCLSL